MTASISGLNSTSFSKIELVHLLKKRVFRRRYFSGSSPGVLVFLTFLIDSSGFATQDLRVPVMGSKGVTIEVAEVSCFKSFTADFSRGLPVFLSFSFALAGTFSTESN